MAQFGKGLTRRAYTVTVRSRLRCRSKAYWKPRRPPGQTGRGRSHVVCIDAHTVPDDWHLARPPGEATGLISASKPSI